MIDRRNVRRLLAWWDARQPADYDEVYALIGSIPTLLAALDAVAHEVYMCESEYDIGGKPYAHAAAIREIRAIVGRQDEPHD